MTKSADPFALTLSLVGQNGGDLEGSMLTLCLQLASNVWAASDSWPAYDNPIQASLDYFHGLDKPNGPSFASQFIARKLAPALCKLTSGR